MEEIYNLAQSIQFKLSQINSKQQISLDTSPNDQNKIIDRSKIGKWIKKNKKKANAQIQVKDNRVTNILSQLQLLYSESSIDNKNEMPFDGYQYGFDVLNNKRQQQQLDENFDQIDDTKISISKNKENRQKYVHSGFRKIKRMQNNLIANNKQNVQIKQSDISTINNNYNIDNGIRNRNSIRKIRKIQNTYHQIYTPNLLKNQQNFTRKKAITSYSENRHSYATPHRVSSSKYSRNLNTKNKNISNNHISGTKNNYRKRIVSNRVAQSQLQNTDLSISPIDIDSLSIIAKKIVLTDRCQVYRQKTAHRKKYNHLR